MEVGPGSYGDPAEGEPSPEDVHDAVQALLDAVDDATGCRWIPFEELPKEEWERSAFLDRVEALADADGIEPLDAKTVDCRNYWIRYKESPAHLTVDSFARAVHRSRMRKRVLEEAARLLADAVVEETGIEPRDLSVERREGRVRARMAGRVMAETEGGSDDPAAVAAELHSALPHDLHDRLVERERRRLARLVVGPVDREVRSVLSEVPDGEDRELAIELCPAPLDSGCGCTVHRSVVDSLDDLPPRDFTRKRDEGVQSEVRVSSRDGIHFVL